MNGVPTGFSMDMGSFPVYELTGLSLEWTFSVFSTKKRKEGKNEGEEGRETKRMQERQAKN